MHTVSKIPIYAVPVKKQVSTEVTQNDVSNAIVDEREDDKDEFCSVAVITNYGVPVALRTDDFGNTFQQSEELWQTTEEYYWY